MSVKEQTMAEFLAEVLAESRANGGPKDPKVRDEMIADGTIELVDPNWRRKLLRLVPTERQSEEQESK